MHRFEDLACWALGWEADSWFLYDFILFLYDFILFLCDLILFLHDFFGGVAEIFG